MESSSSTSKMVAMPLLLSLRGGVPVQKILLDIPHRRSYSILKVVSRVLYRRGQAPSKGRIVSSFRITAPGKPSVNFPCVPNCEFF